MDHLLDVSRLSEALAAMLTTRFELALLAGVVAALLMVLSNLMKRMVPLRLFAMGANSLFIAQAALEDNRVFFALQLALLLINAYRLWNLRQLLRSLERAHAEPPIKDWLLPQMRKKRFKAGTILFTQGEVANELFYIQSGTVESPQFGQPIGEGNLVGGISLFSDDHIRTATLVCKTDVVSYTMSGEAVYLLYLQNPQIALYLIRLVIRQLRSTLWQQPATVMAAA